MGVGSALPVCCRVSSSSVSSRVPKPAGYGHEALGLLHEHELAGEEVLHGHVLGVVVDDVVGSGLEGEPDADADGPVAAGAFHGGEHDPRAGTGDHHPSRGCQRGGDIVGLAVERVFGQRARRAEDRDLGLGLERGEHEERIAHLVDGRRRDLEVQPLGTVLA